MLKTFPLRHVVFELCLKGQRCTFSKFSTLICPLNLSWISLESIVTKSGSSLTLVISAFFRLIWLRLCQSCLSVQLCFIVSMCRSFTLYFIYFHPNLYYFCHYCVSRNLCCIISLPETTVFKKLSAFCFVVFYVYWCFACLYINTPHACLRSQARRGHWVPQNCTYRWLWDTTWQLGTEPGLYAKSASA